MKKRLLMILYVFINFFICFADEFYNGCLYKVTGEGEAKITMFFDKIAVIPIRINNYPVTEIEPLAISHKESVVVEKNHPCFYVDNSILYSKQDSSLIYSFSKDSTVFIPEGIKRIRESAFSGLELKNVIIPDSVIDIDDFAFRGSWNLHTLHLSKYVKHIGACAFPRGCKVTLYGNPFFEEREGFLIEKQKNKLVYSFSVEKNVTIPDDIKVIETFAFVDQDNLKTVDLPSYIIIEPWAFSGNKYLERIDFKNGFSLIGEHAFDGCSSLKDIVLPEKILRIENTTFNHCDSLEYIDLPDDLKEIEFAAFSNCINLKEIRIPANVSYIGNRAIPSSTRIILDSNNFTLSKGILFDANFKKVIYCSDTVEKVIIPDTVDTIFYGVFSDCFNLKEIYIPTSVSIILGDYPKSTLIRCKKQSAAHEWCIKNNHIFELVD